MTATAQRDKLGPVPPDTAPLSEHLDWLASATERLARKREAAGLAKQAKALRANAQALQSVAGEFRDQGQ